MQPSVTSKKPSLRAIASQSQNIDFNHKKTKTYLPSRKMPKAMGEKQGYDKTIKTQINSNHM